MGMISSMRLTVHTECSPLQLLDIFLESGWTQFCWDRIMYLPLGDNGEDFDWQSSPVNKWDEVYAILQQKNAIGELIGIDLNWQDTLIGGIFHFQYAGDYNNEEKDYKRIWTVLNDNRPFLLDQVTDHGWFLQRIIPVLSEAGVGVTEIECSDSW